MLLQVKDLHVDFRVEQGVSKALTGVSFFLEKGEILGLIGESGSGKSVIALSIMRLISHPGTIRQGSILFNGQDLLTLSEKKMRQIRGTEISMVFQDPMTALNPIHTCGTQLIEAIQQHRQETQRSETARAIELLRLVGISDPEKRMVQYPHELSGGMRQRVMIAMAISCFPKILIADEPTTALDVTVQAQILELIERLKKTMSMSVIFITHNLGIVSEICTSVAVIYASKIVESTTPARLFANPLHPYTQGLLKSIPRARVEKERLYIIKGNVPSSTDLPKGCNFCTRCDQADQQCFDEEPPLIEYDKGRMVACWKVS